jgi:hypothetical protein
MTVRNHNDPPCEKCVGCSVAYTEGVTEHCWPCASSHLKCEFCKYLVSFVLRAFI